MSVVGKAVPLDAGRQASERSSRRDVGQRRCLRPNAGSVASAAGPPGVVDLAPHLLQGLGRIGIEENGGVLRRSMTLTSSRPAAVCARPHRREASRRVRRASAKAARDCPNDPRKPERSRLRRAPPRNGRSRHRARPSRRAPCQQGRSARARVSFGSAAIPAMMEVESPRHNVGFDRDEVEADDRVGELLRFRAR